jgi:hypothetical protein
MVSTVPMPRPPLFYNEPKAESYEGELACNRPTIDLHTYLTYLRLSSHADLIRELKRREEDKATFFRHAHAEGCCTSPHTSTRCTHASWLPRQIHHRLHQVLCYLSWAIADPVADRWRPYRPSVEFEKMCSPRPWMTYTPPPPGQMA